MPNFRDNIYIFEEKTKQFFALIFPSYVNRYFVLEQISPIGKSQHQKLLKAILRARYPAEIHGTITMLLGKMCTRYHRVKNASSPVVCIHIYDVPCRIYF